ncbi:MAG: HtaA domain-containing protein [Microbacteriaceae bacterium]
MKSRTKTAPRVNALIAASLTALLVIAGVNLSSASTAFAQEAPVASADADQAQPTAAPAEVGADELPASDDATATEESGAEASDAARAVEPGSSARVTAPTITVSQTTELTPAGEVVTVTGSGFSPNAPSTNGSRPPLAGKFAGAYVVFGKFADTWKPSEGASSSTRKVGSQKWVVNAEDVPTIGATQGVAINADGTFSVELLVSRGFTGEPATGNYGIYTFPGSGASYAPFETYTPLSFTTAPVVAVSQSSDLSVEGETVTVRGWNFSPNAPSTNGSRPPLAGKFAGAYVVFGKFADTWKPSEGASSSTRKVGSQKWVVNAEDVPTIGATQGVAINADGTFSVELLVSRGFTGEPATGNYGIYTFPGSGASYAPFETYTPLSFTTARTTIVTVGASPASPTEGGSVTLSAAVSPLADGIVTFTRGSRTLGTSAVSATGTASLVVSSLSAGVQEFRAEFTPTNALVFAASSGTVSVSVAQKVVGAGSLTWGIKQSFRDYVSGSIAQGSVTGSGVSTSGGAFVFGQSSGGTFTEASGTGTSRYNGSVRFVGHEGLLDVQISNPVIRVDSASRGTLLVSVNGGAAIEFATLNLASGSKTTPNNTVRYASVPAVLTARGASVFSFNGSPFYSSGTALESLTFVIGSASSSGGGATTVASYSKKLTTPDATAPSSTGITLVGADGATGGTVVAGATVSIEASGFAPNERGILVVIYSEPVVLSNSVVANSSGVARWTGALPAELTGEHTLTFQGSVDRGIALTIAPNTTTAAVDGCAVTGGKIIWGFKESFRSYISGSIANGEWTLSDGASYETPLFTWSDGTGTYDGAASSGLVSFPGAVTFTGHGGILNTTVSNPSVRFDSAGKAVLVADITGTTQAGEEVNALGVDFVELDLAAGATVDVTEGTIAFSDVPTVLLPAGAEAFGTYEAGEPFDPITVTFATGADCAAAAAIEPEAVTDVVETDESGSSILWIAIAVLVLIALIVTIVLVRRRNTSKTES